MKKVLVENLEDGMILAKPVIGQNGNVLLNAGIEMKSNMAERLKRWGITIIYIAAEESDEELAEKEEFKDQKSKELEAVFEDVIDNPLMKIIYIASKKHIEAMDGN